MEVINPNGVKVYNLSAGKTFPKFLSAAQRRKLAKDDEYRTRIELIQDFEFNQSCQKVKVSQDGNYIMTSGVYPPMVKCYDTQQMSEKFRRHLECEIVQFQFLSEDFSKFAFLLADRTLEFHARYGFHYRTRIPKFGRDITYHKERCELFAVGSSPEIYRLDLEQGTFMASINAHCSELNKVVLAPVHQMLTVGNIKGEIECYDSRNRECLQCVKIFDSEVRDLRFSADGMQLAVGSDKGEVKVFDIRNNRPFLELEHVYETPITSMKFSGQYLLTADRRTVKISNLKTNECLCNLEPESPINHMNIVTDSGLLFVAAEQPRILSYFIPSLGPAPRWCSFLDNLAEELEEEKAGVYDDYKFVTRKELAELGLENLIGSDMLKAYMHGYFVDNKLYQRAKSVANPSLYEDYKKEQARKKQKEKAEKRITLNTKKPAVNADLAERWQRDGKKAEEVDDRFSQLFKNEDFAIDQTSEEFRRSYASGMGKRAGDSAQIDSDDENEENSMEGEDDEDENIYSKRAKDAFGYHSNRGDDDENGDDDEDDDEVGMLEEDFDLLDDENDDHDGGEHDNDDNDDNDMEEEEEVQSTRYVGRSGKKERAEKERIKPKKGVRFYGVKADSKVKIPTSKSEMKKEVEKRKERRTMSMGQRARELDRRSRK